MAQARARSTAEPKSKFARCSRRTDFGKEFTPELRAQEDRLRAQIGARAGTP